MKAFQWSAASLLSILCTFSVSVQAAPGGVSFNDAGLWLKTDDAGDIAVAWKDNSGASNNVEVRVTGSAAPWALSEADAAHNFHPYTTGYQNNRLFHDTDASFVEEGDNVTPLTMIAVTRLVSLPDTDSVARIMGLANSSLPEAAEPGLSVAGDDSDYAGRLQLSFESEFSAWPDYLYSSPVPLAESVINFAVVGGSNNTDVTLGYNNTQAFSVADEPVVTRGDTVSIGYGTRFAESAQPFNGDIMEVIWYADELSENELQRVHSYLAVKHGIGLTGDYLASDNTVVWQSTINSAYNTDVFGLGRDDTSGLNQLISRSVTSPELTVSTATDFVSGNNIARPALGADRSFALIGHNGGAVSFSSMNVSGSYSYRSERAWLYQASSLIAPLAMKFDLPALAAGSKVYLVRRNADDDFSAGAVTLGEVNSSTGEIAGIELTDGDYFTLAITLDSDEDGVIDPEDAFPNDPTETEDTDGDGIGDNADTDDDGDGYTDDDEVLAGSDPKDDSSVPADNDNDGISDVTDTDDDNDGLSDSDEALVGTDPENPDSDSDGVLDGAEVGSDAANPRDENGDGVADVFTPTNDSDQDGLSNYVETLIGSDPTRRDSDGDDFRDDEELAVTLSGSDTDNDGIDDAMDADSTGAPDRDGDGIADFSLRDTDDNGTPDLLDTDSDADGVDDLTETLNDVDADGVADVRDPDDSFGGGDSDADALPDSLECCGDADQDGVPNYMQSDSDSDSIPDGYEAGIVSPADDDGDGYDNRYDADINGDGVLDNGPDADSNGLRDNWLPLDTDGDGQPDYADTDSDNDGVSDEDETLFGSALTDDADGDGIPSQVDASQGENGGDSDKDGLSDSEECPEGYPYCRDTDSNGTPDYMSVDSDGDGIPDAEDPDTSPGGGDSDGDGIGDAEECPVAGECPDSDGDGIPDYLDDDTQYQAPDGDENQGEEGVDQAPEAPEALSDHMTSSTGVGAFSVPWGMFALLLIRRRSIALALALSTMLAMPATAAEWSKERLYMTGSAEYSRFSPETEDSVYTVSDRHDWGVSLGAGYDLFDQWAVEFDFSQKGELQALRNNTVENAEYSFAAASVAWYPSIWYSNRRYDDTWPHKLNWFISSGVSRMFVSGSANNELENPVNLSIGGGVTYGLSSGVELKATAERLSGDVFSWGLGLSWYPYAPASRGQAGRSYDPDEERTPLYQPYQVASQRVARTHVADCGLQLKNAQIEFSESSYLLQREYFSRLDEISDDFFKCPGVTLVVVGTGEQAGMDKDSRRDDLAYQRARAVYQYLVRRGVPSNRVVISTRPVDDDAVSEHRAEVFFAR
mgnify:FL=1